jgi:hypothetical protein
MTTNHEVPSEGPLDSFQQAILALDISMQDFRSKETWTVKDACEIYGILANFKSQLAILVNDHENYLIEFMKQNDTDAVILESGMAVTREQSKNRKGWKHKDLAETVASRIESLAYDMDTGERVMTTSQMITKLLDYVQPSYWRVTTLSEIGVNPDDFCEAGNVETKIRIGKVK